MIVPSGFVTASPTVLDAAADVAVSTAFVADERTMRPTVVAVADANAPMGMGMGMTLIAERNAPSIAFGPAYPAPLIDHPSGHVVPGFG